MKIETDSEYHTEKELKEIQNETCWITKHKPVEQLQTLKREQIFNNRTKPSVLYCVLCFNNQNNGNISKKKVWILFSF